MVNGFVRTQENKEEARRWIELGESGKLRTAHFLELSACYPNDPIYEALLTSSNCFVETRFTLHQDVVNFTTDLGIDGGFLGFPIPRFLLPRIGLLSEPIGAILVFPKQFPLKGSWGTPPLDLG